MFKSAFSDRSRVTFSTTGPSRTKQSFKQDCDISHILNKYVKNGLLSHAQTFGGTYGDFIDAVDYQLGLDKIMEANDMFMTLPSSVRKRFDNDPSAFLDFVHDESNLEEMKSLGLIVEQPVQKEAKPTSSSESEASAAPSST